MHGSSSTQYSTGAKWEVVVVVALLMLPGIALAGPWVPAAGEGYAKVGLSGVAATRYSNSNGDPVDMDTYLEAGANVYLEAGLGASFGAHLQWTVANWFKSDDEVWSLGEPELGLTRSIYSQGPWRVAGHGAARLPIAKQGAQFEIGGPAGRVGELVAGTGSLVVPLGISAGWSGGGNYAVVGVAYAWAADGVRDLIETRWEYGGNSHDVWKWRGRVTTMTPIGSTSAPTFESPTGMSNDSSFISWNFEGEYGLSDAWWLGASFAGAVPLDLRRQALGPRLAIYVATKF